jgi:hypothetical protein
MLSFCNAVDFLQRFFGVTLGAWEENVSKKHQVAFAPHGPRPTFECPECSGRTLVLTYAWEGFCNERESVVCPGNCIACVNF